MAAEKLRRPKREGGSAGEATPHFPAPRVGLERALAPDVIIIKANSVLAPGQGQQRLVNATDKNEVEFIRLFFEPAVEEEIAYRWAMRLARVIGLQAQELRPGTTLEEMLKWGAAAQADPMDFVVVFEPELRLELAWFLDNSEHTTFREMVQHCAWMVAR